MLAIRSLALAVLLSSLTSCAAMFTGTKDEVSITAFPAAGTSVQIGDEVYSLDEVPSRIRKSTKEVVFSNPSYGQYVVPVKRSFQGGLLALDILFTPGYGLSGILVDGFTSAWYELPSDIEFDFTSEIARQSGDDDGNGRRIEKQGPAATPSPTEPVLASATLARL